jgi:hypothetical protein
MTLEIQLTSLEFQLESEGQIRTRVILEEALHNISSRAWIKVRER